MAAAGGGERKEESVLSFFSLFLKRDRTKRGKVGGKLFFV